MSGRASRMDPRLTAATSAAVTITMLVTLLLVQHVRHGWPFSLHHGLPPIGPEPRDRASDTAHRVTDAVAVAGAERAAVAVDPVRLAALGVTFEPARYEDLGSEIRAVVTIAPDEGRSSHVHTRVSGWIERLHVRTTGEHVRSGQPLAAIFSRELLASQTEYLSALRASRGGAPSSLATGARQRLVVLGMTDRDISALERRGTALRDVTVSAPRSGAVLHRGVSVGTAVDPSTELFTIVDLSAVWALAELPEEHAASIHVGAPATIEIPGAGGDPVEASVSFVYPTLTERTRTLRVRLEIENADGAIRPGMFGTATFTVAPRRVLTISRDAVVDTGRRQHVFVRASHGGLEPRRVEIGARAGGRVAVLEGLAEGEVVVASGVFVIDSESRLRVAGGTGAGHQHGATQPTVAPPPPGEGDEHTGHAE